MEQFERIIQHLQKDFDEISMARPPFVLEKFVVGNHEHEAQQWAHCVLELQVKYDAIRRAMIQKKIIQLEIEQLESKQKPILSLKAELRHIDLEEQDRAMLGAIREFEALYRIYQSFGRRFTRQELDEAQPDYWRARLTKQAEQDVIATGKVSQGNQEALRQISSTMPGINARIQATEQNFLANGDVKLLIVVATEFKAESGLPVLDGLNIPTGVQYKIHNIYGMPVAAAYNEAVMIARRDNAHYLLTVEDDTYPPADGLYKLFAHKRPIVGGWYRKRQEVYEGVPIIVKDGRRQGLNEPDGNTQEVYGLPMGFTLFDLSIFDNLPYPWFVTTAQMSQDSYFSQLAREAGYQLWCDTSIRCNHVDRETGVIYGYNLP